MNKKVKKALFCAAAAVAAAGLTLTAACSGEYYKSTALKGDYSYEGEAISNGGFVVQAGGYVYFVNGVESNTANNSYGEVTKGALVRISTENLAAGNYSSVDVVVPQIVYSGAYEGGIYIYGDYVYYSTPSTAKDSNGDVLNDNIEFKRTKLDGTEAMKGSFYSSEDLTIDYRYVEVDGTVYLIYSASEQLYGTQARTNIHSVNTSTGENTILAYNVSSYVFDTKDATNPYIYYTMAVTENLGTDNESTADYNQIYRVRADATESPREYDFSYVEDYDKDTNPLYINLGEFVFDGMGTLSADTQFNYTTDKTNILTLSGYTYSLVSLENGVLYYTRAEYSSEEDGNTPILFYATDAQISAESWNPVKNPSIDAALLRAADAVTDYTFVTDQNNIPKGIIYSDSADSGYAIMSATFSGGALTDKFAMTTASDEITIMTFSEESVNGQTYEFLYYGVTGEGNSYSIHRIAVGGTDEQYNELPAGTDEDASSNYRDVKILDLDANASWFMPEVVCGQLFFASDTDDMVDYSYIMAFDMRSDKTAKTGNATISNADIENINNLFNDITDEENGVIAEIDEEKYENLPNALKYVFYTRDSAYLPELVNMWIDEGEEEDYIFSAEAAQIYLDFAKAEGEYKDFAAYKRTVNGEEVLATSRDYYYCVVGKMSESDAEKYADELKADYMPAEPEPEQSWFESLSTGAKVGFIIGVCVGGLIVIAAAVLIPLLIIAKKRRTLPDYAKRRIKVDTTDDKNIDVYSDENSQSESGENS